MYNEDARSALEDLLDNLELLADRKDDQRSVMSGSDVRLNIYDMVGAEVDQLVLANICKLYSIVSAGL